MDHRQAKKIFAEIQARPYQCSSQMGVPANNCYFKGIELLQRLGILGYTVRGRVGETYWDDKIIPADIIKLASPEFKVTHFVTEIQIDGVWRCLDPSFQPTLAKHGFPIGSWEGGELCFPITKLYSQEESITYQAEWNDMDYAKSYFDKNATFFRAFNMWILSLENK